MQLGKHTTTQRLITQYITECISILQYGNYALTTDLKFNGSVEFNSQALRPWVFQNKEVGQVQNTSLMTFLRIYEAGHEVPYYQPKNALAMFAKWVSNKAF